MKKFKLQKENIPIVLIVILSAILNFANLSIEGYGNSYYAAAVKSMTLSLKNFFFVSFDPAGFVTIDKPPVGFWLQAISAKIFGYSGVSILLPSALAGVVSVILIYKIVKRSFGNVAGLLSAFFLAITPVFVAVSRNNTIDNILIMFLLLALWALTIAAEKGKFKYLIISLALVGVGFNVKMLEAYLVVPAIYLTYLLSTATSIKKKITHLIAATLVLVVVSFSWAVVVDLVPSSMRPYVDSSTNNSEIELIVGHNGSERLSFGSSSSSQGGPGGGSAPSGKMSGSAPSGMSQNAKPQGSQATNSSSNQNSGMPGSSSSKGSMPSGGSMTQGGGPSGSQGSGTGMGGNSQLQGTFGGQVTAGIQRLFIKSMLSDQVVWFIPLAIIGFIAAAIKEKLSFKLKNKKQQSLVMWLLWFLPEFIYFSFNTGTFHPYYLTMLAVPTAALAGIGIASMWELYKEGGKKAWFLPIALLLTAATDFLMLSYFIDYSVIVKILFVVVAVLSVLASIALIVLNFKDSKANIALKKKLVALAIIGIAATPLVGSGAAIFTAVNGTIPAAGLELLSSSQSSPSQGQGNNSKMSSSSGKSGNTGMPSGGGDSTSKLITFLEANKTSNQKYLLVVSNSNSASDIIIKTGQSVMSLGGFLGSDNTITLDQFKELVKEGQIRYVMTGGMGGGQGSSISSIMSWVEKNGKLVASSEYSSTNNSQTTSASSSSKNSSSSSNTAGSMGQSQQLYDLKAYTDSVNK